VQDLGLVSKDALAEAILDAVAPLLSPDPEAGN
jgi:hypothetical protein